MVSSRLFDLFCISNNWKAAFVFVLGWNKFLSDLFIISDSLVIWKCLCDSLQVLSPWLSLVCWKAMAPQMFLDTFMYLPPVTLWAHENEHEASSTFLSLFSSPIFYIGCFCQCFLVKQCLWIHAACVCLSVYVIPCALPPHLPKSVSLLVSSFGKRIQIWKWSSYEVEREKQMGTQESLFVLEASRCCQLSSAHLTFYQAPENPHWSVPLEIRLHPVCQS